MKVLVLIEPKDGGGFRATVGEPFRLSADAETETQATQQLATLLRERLQRSRVAVLDLENGTPTTARVPFLGENVPGEDWFWETMQKTIEENRKREDEAEVKE